MATWQKLGLWCEANLLRLQEAWNIQLPPPGTLPSEADEQSIDKWCEEIARDPKVMISPPAELQPWILVRLVCAVGICQWYQARFEVPALANPKEALRRVLIDEWHQDGREGWKLRPSRPPESRE